MSYHLDELLQVGPVADVSGVVDAKLPVGVHGVDEEPVVVDHLVGRVALVVRVEGGGHPHPLAVGHRLEVFVLGLKVVVEGGDEGAGGLAQVAAPQHSPRRP